MKYEVDIDSRLESLSLWIHYVLNRQSTCRLNFALAQPNRGNDINIPCLIHMTLVQVG